MGCGGDKDTEEESGGDSGDQGAGSSGTQGGGDEKVTLAKFLPGKRIAFSVRPPDAPPEVPEMTALIQFESDGTITMGTMADGGGLARLAPGDLSVQRGDAGLQLLHRQRIEVFAQHLAERFGGARVFGIVHKGKC